MEYKIYDRITKTFENDSCIVTQEGKVAFWDNGAGWQEEEENNRYIVIFQEGHLTMERDEIESIISKEYHDLQIPEFLLQKLRRREGLTAVDISKDQEFHERDPMVNLRSIAAFEFSDPGLADQIMDWAKRLGVKHAEG